MVRSYRPGQHRSCGSSSAPPATAGCRPSSSLTWVPRKQQPVPCGPPGHDGVPRLLSGGWLLHSLPFLWQRWASPRLRASLTRPGGAGHRPNPSRSSGVTKATDKRHCRSVDASSQSDLGLSPRANLNRRQGTSPWKSGGRRETNAFLWERVCMAEPA